MQRSLLSALYQEENEEFKDAIESDDQKTVNEWELSVKIVESKIEIEVTISDLRFVFAVPTA